MVMEIYDKQGRPISMEEYTRLKFESEDDYHRIGETAIGPYVVSTVWLGLNHRFVGPGPPLIFETMVFLGSEWRGEESGLMDIDVVRYATEQEAMNGHVEMCLLVRATMQEEFDGEAGAGQEHPDAPEDADGEDPDRACCSRSRDAGGDARGDSSNT